MINLSIQTKRLLFFVCLMITATTSFSQITVSGVVLDGINGGGLPGATVSIKGRKVGTTTDIDGKYSLILKKDTLNNLQFNMVGYKTQYVWVEDTVINITLKADVKQIEEKVTIYCFGGGPPYPINGTVIDEMTGLDIYNVHVIYKGMKIETKTDMLGKFSITGNGRTVDLEFSRYGYITKDVVFTKKDDTSIKVELQQDTMNKSKLTTNGKQ